MLKVIPHDIRFDGCSLITGFHGIGGVGYWTVRYLAQKLNAERAAIIDSDIISPATTTYSGRIVTPYEILRKEDLAFFKVEVPPLREKEVGLFRSFSKWVIDAGFKEVALIGGLDSSLRIDETTFRLVHTSSFVPKDELAKALILEDDHLIVGPVAIMLNYFEVMKIPAFAILAYASPERVDPRATAAAISVLSNYYKFEVDVMPLIKGAEALEQEAAKQEIKSRRGGESIYT
ncbi:MAG: proteasome assembly chaperone family protein [archaeon]|nr:proteasome assembly chaperone family protein [archaeon]MCP8320651.1 proteasome assembly chaperone family protein [archaeon]